MLKTLRISRIAIIDDITLHFNHGLTALTGETGAGKSIIMESLQLLFGKRSDAQLIRDGFDEAIVSGTFRLSQHVMKQFDLPEDITIERVISRSGKHVMKVQDKSVTLQYIKQLTPYIGDIHEQDDMYQLLDPSQYLDLLDGKDKASIEPLKLNYLLAKSDYEAHIKNIETWNKERHAFLEKQDMYAFQKQELDAFQLEPDILQKIDEEIETLKHFDLITQQLHIVDQLFSERMIDDSVYEVFHALKKIEPYLPQSIPNQDIEIAYYTLKETYRTVRKTLEQLDFDPLHFEMLQQRSFDIKSLLKKYQMTIDELMMYHQGLSKQLLLAHDYDGFMKDAQKTLDQLKQNVIKEAKRLHAQRQLVSKHMEKDIVEVLKQLGLNDATFSMDLQCTDTMFSNGMDTLEFYMSLNEGESLKPLHKVASGGERARFMFALKATHAKHHQVSMLILDEIDSGVSGQIAAKVANFMEVLSKDMQVIVITHLPQVAAKATTHIGVKKSLVDGRMTTHIVPLEGDHRVSHIAMMLSDETISPFAIEQAKVLLNKHKA